MTSRRQVARYHKYFAVMSHSARERERERERERRREMAETSFADKVHR